MYSFCFCLLCFYMQRWRLKCCTCQCCCYETVDNSFVFSVLLLWLYCGCWLSSGLLFTFYKNKVVTKLDWGNGCSLVPLMILGLILTTRITKVFTHLLLRQRRLEKRPGKATTQSCWSCCLKLLLLLTTFCCCCPMYDRIRMQKS